MATVEAHLDDLNEHVIREVQLDSGVVRTLRYRDRAGAPPVEAPTPVAVRFGLSARGPPAAAAT